MAPTSDERREVAREMREVTDDECDAIYIDGILCRILGDRYCRDDEFQISSKLILPRLADLIDPTCEIDGGQAMSRFVMVTDDSGFSLAINVDRILWASPDSGIVRMSGTKLDETLALPPEEVKRLLDMVGVDANGTD